MDNPIREFLVVAAGGQPFAVATARITSVVAARPVTPLPFVPAWVEGLVTVNDRIVPQLGLATLLAGAADPAGGELVLVDTSRGACALRVAQVLGKAELDAGAVQPLAGEGEAERLPVESRFERDGGNVLVLDIDRVGALVGGGEVAAGERGLLGRLQEEEDVAAAARLDGLVVVVAGERYALALGDVVEVLDLPLATPLPGAPAGVEGLSTVRDHVLLVLSLAHLLGLPGRPPEGTGSVIVVERDGQGYGLRVDAVEGLLQAEAADLRRIEDAGSEVEAVVAAGDRLLGLLTPARLLPEARLRQYQALAPRQARQAAGRAERRHSVLQVVLGEEVFGIALERVRRIVDYRPPEPVPGEGGGRVAGVVNIEGRVVPVLDLATQLRAGGDNAGAWVILDDGRDELAVAVREATDIIAIPDSALEPVQSGSGLVTAIARVQGRLVSLLSLESLAEEA